MVLRDPKDEIRLILTDDGSHSLFVPSLNETYHSFHGAVQESKHVFIKMGLAYHTKFRQGKSVKVFEVGMGTGLNALLAAEFAYSNKISVVYHSIEAFPIKPALVKELNYPSLLSTEYAKEWFDQIHASQWNENALIHSHFQIHKIHSRLEDYNFNSKDFDIIFFDAFAPNKQAELWDLEIIKAVTSLMKSGGTFVTYCAKGQLKRDLQRIGLQVDTLPGPPGKKEMVRAIKS